MTSGKVNNYDTIGLATIIDKWKNDTTVCRENRNVKNAQKLINYLETIADDSAKVFLILGKQDFGFRNENQSINIYRFYLYPYCDTIYNSLSADRCWMDLFVDQYKKILFKLSCL